MAMILEYIDALFRLLGRLAIVGALFILTIGTRSVPLRVLTVVAALALVIWIVAGIAKEVPRISALIDHPNFQQWSLRAWNAVILLVLGFFTLGLVAAFLLAMAEQQGALRQAAANALSAAHSAKAPQLSVPGK